MDAHEASAVLAEAERRRQQTVTAGVAPWPWRLLGVWAGALVAYGLALDLDLVWVGGLLIIAALLAGGQRMVRLRGTHTPSRWALALAVAVAMLVVDIAVQSLVRWADGPLPNAVGALAAALLLLLVRPMQARIAAARRP
ncbi:hypothetical protein [uncultured Friedmanniella sp.]|uniref:hypothetical protein n=1 Tax=uncultured Friedmanniella sp. TaxID=335381 RepID=UPI0035C96371